MSYYSTVLELLIQQIQIGNTVKLSLLEDDMIMHVLIPLDSPKYMFQTK